MVVPQPHTSPALLVPTCQHRGEMMCKLFEEGTDIQTRVCP